MSPVPSLGKLLASPRSLVALALCIGAIWFGMTHIAHHANESPFQTLYLHLKPEALVWHPPHAEPGVEAAAPGPADHVLAVPANFLPALFTRPLGAGPEDSPSGQRYLVLTNLQLFQLLAVLLVLVFFSGVPKHVRTGQGDAPTRMAAGFAQWIRDEMVYPVMHKELGSKFLPYFLCVFFFILFMNLAGLLPGAATATASIFVTAALALTTFLSMIVCGMAIQGPIAFWKHLVPHVPLALWPLMFVVELIGLLVKPFALMIRLFANMTGGHLVVLSFMGLIFFFAQQMGAAAGWGVSPLAVGFAVFIMIIESFVALLQAYVFTQLSILFVNASVHPEH
ncbi:MAG: F0F1 ATP synthase subunit A [Planctomycetes bacterium]|nr:F0F1 ATP synthase subunit A [Planctomycetota bacterium]